MSVFFIRDSRNRVLTPTTKLDLVRKLLSRGKAKFIRNRIFLIQLSYPITSNSKDTETQFVIGLDSGYKNIGFSVFKISKDKVSKLFSGEATLRTEEISELLSERKMYRQSRRRCRRNRANSFKFRHPRWRNRRDKSNLNPTIRHLIQSHTNIIKFILKYIPVERTYLNLEYAKFDLQKISNATNSSGNGYGNTKAYILARDTYTCQYCGAIDTQLEVHHKVERSKGGTNRPDNLITLCSSCHSKHHAGKINANFLVGQQYRDSGVMNSAMKYIYTALAGILPTYKYFGYETTEVRNKLNIEKSHINDANVLASFNLENIQSYADHKIKPLDIQQIRRHSSRAKTSRLEDRKYKRIDWSDKSESLATNRNKRTGQTENSLADLRRLGELLSGNLNYSTKVRAIPGGKVYRQERIDFQPGDLVKNTTSNTTFVVKGVGAGYSVYGFDKEKSPRQNPKTKKPQTSTVKVKSNGGLCLI